MCNVIEYSSHYFLEEGNNLLIVQLSEHTYLFYGAGEAGIGIAELVIFIRNNIKATDFIVILPLLFSCPQRFTNKPVALWMTPGNY